MIISIFVKGQKSASTTYLETPQTFVLYDITGNSEGVFSMERIMEG
jgi:hypothetical protein